MVDITANPILTTYCRKIQINYIKFGYLQTAKIKTVKNFLKWFVSKRLQ